jgi:hypothetical protein
MTTYIYDAEVGKIIEKPRVSKTTGPFLMGDIEPYQNMKIVAGLPAVHSTASSCGATTLLK